MKLRSMLHRMLMVLFALLFAVSTGTVLAQSHFEGDLDAWLEWAELGPHQPEVEDWDAIYAAAQDEPTLVVYAGTSRVLAAMEDLLEVYPGLQMEMLNLESAPLLERVVREWDAGLRNVGVLFSALPSTHHEVLLPRQAVTRYVPREIEQVMREEETRPLLRQRYSTYVWFFNSEEHDAPPWTNIWELTTEEYRNRVVLGDMFADFSTQVYFAALYDHAEEMAALYEEFFGEPLVPEAENAGLEFMKRLLENDVRIVPAPRDVAETVHHSTGSFAGLTGYSRYRQALDGTYNIGVDIDRTPIALDYWYVSIGTFTQSPNTAKLLIHWLMTAEGGVQWAGPNFPANPEVTMLQPGFELTLADFPTAWDVSSDDFVDIQDILLDYWQLWR